MIEISPFVAGDLDEIALQEAQLPDLLAHGLETSSFLEASGPGFTARDRAGQILQCSGFIQNHAAYASAWAFLSTGWGAHAIALTRSTRGVIAATGWRRIDMSVRAGFEPGAHWARMLGFHLEGRLEAMGPEGDDFEVYALIRRGI